MTGRRHLQLSLRWRVAAAFGMGSFLLSSVLAFATWNLSSGYLLRQREQSVVRQAEVNVRMIDEELRRGAEHVRRHDGRVWVQDRPGGGARFVVEIPEVPTL